MGRVYSISFTAQTIATASGDYDLFEIGPADDAPVALHAISLGQTSELGDTAEEQMAWQVIRGHTTGSNGSATTARPMNPLDTAAAAACETVGSTVASSGTGVTLHSSTFNIRAGLDYVWAPEMRPKCSQGQGLIVVRMSTTVADDLTLSGSLYFEELA